MTVRKFPRNLDIEHIFFFIETLKEQVEGGARFWKGEDTPGDGIETVFGRTDDTDTIIGQIDVTDCMTKLIDWLGSLRKVKE